MSESKYYKLERRLATLITQRVEYGVHYGAVMTDMVLEILKNGTGDLYQTLAEEFGCSREEAKVRTFTALYGGKIPDLGRMKERREKALYLAQRKRRFDTPRPLGPYHRSVCYRGADRKVVMVSTSYEVSPGKYGERVEFTNHGNAIVVYFPMPLTRRQLQALGACRRVEDFKRTVDDLGAPCGLHENEWKTFCNKGEGIPWQCTETERVSRNLEKISQHENTTDLPRLFRGLHLYHDKDAELFRGQCVGFSADGRCVWYDSGVDGSEYVTFNKSLTADQVKQLFLLMSRDTFLKVTDTTLRAADDCVDKFDNTKEFGGVKFEPANGFKTITSEEQSELYAGGKGIELPECCCGGEAVGTTHANYCPRRIT